MMPVRMPRKSKYGAKPVMIDGIRFASTREGKRYAELKLLARAGEINGLELQPHFPFALGLLQTPIFTYIPDFTYYTKDGERVIEDVKGVRNAVYKLKKRIIEAHYRIEIREV